MNNTHHNYGEARCGGKASFHPRSGLSLLELVVVMTILVATAVLVLPIINTVIVTPTGETKTANEITTESTMLAIRTAIVGDQGVMESLGHEPDALPREVSELVAEQPPVHLQIRRPNLVKFDPFFGIGWHGPYVVPTGKNEQGQPTVVDGWGKEIKLQVDFDANGEVDANESKYIRIVSGGPNGRIDTPADTLNMQPGDDEIQQLTMLDCGDDLVLFLCVPDLRR